MTIFKNDGEKSELQAAIEARPRTTWEFEGRNFVARSSNVEGKFRMRVATLIEHEESLRAADKYMADREKGLTKETSNDILSNVRVAYLLHTVTLDPVKNRPAFESARWMLAHLGADELGVLLHHYQECLRLTGPIDLDITDEKVDGLVALLAAQADTDVPNAALMVFTREQLGEILVRVALKLVAARQESGPGPLTATVERMADAVMASQATKATT